MKSGRIIYLLIIGFVFMYLFYSMMRFNDGSAGRQVDSIQRIVDKALVQCYALEGSYPTSIDRVVEYGVILDRERFIFHYEWFGSNMKPSVMVLERMR